MIPGIAGAKSKGVKAQRCYAGLISRSSLHVSAALGRTGTGIMALQTWHAFKFVLKSHQDPTAAP